MTQQRDLEQLLDQWFADGPNTASDRVIDAVADRISRQPQRPAWRLDWRPNSMMNSIRLAAVAAGIVLAAGLVVTTVNRASGPGGPTPSPSPRSTPSASAPSSPAASIGCWAGGPGCAGPLMAGDHRSAQFMPFVTFTTADNLWRNSFDLPSLYGIDSASGYFMLWSAAAIAEQTPSCQPKLVSGAGTKPADWINYVTHHPGLNATNVHTVLIGGPIAKGGRSGLSVDVASKSTWMSPCRADDFLPNLVQFVVDTGASPAGPYGVSSDIPIRLVALDVDGKTVLIEYYSQKALFDSSVVRAEAVIETMRFGCGPAAGRPCLNP